MPRIFGCCMLKRSKIRLLQQHPNHASRLAELDGGGLVPKVASGESNEGHGLPAGAGQGERLSRHLPHVFH
ncbi:unnamed protein product [Pylaiella littoralis]